MADIAKPAASDVSSVLEEWPQYIRGPVTLPEQGSDVPPTLELNWDWLNSAVFSKKIRGCRHYSGSPIRGEPGHASPTKKPRCCEADTGSTCAGGGLPVWREILAQTPVEAGGQDKITHAKPAIPASSAAWPCWRGPGSVGVRSTALAATQWSEDKGILWKASVPGKGHASPIVFEDPSLSQRQMIRHRYRR